MQNSASLSRTHTDALPWPLAWLWHHAAQARRPEDVHAAAEGVVRALVAMVLADCLDVPWNEAARRALGADAEARSLARPSFGTRVAWLRALVSVHAGLPGRILPSLNAWWSTMDGPRGALTRLVEQRNAVAHAGARTGGGTSNAFLNEGVTLLASVLRAGWLREVQLLCLDSPDVRLPRPGTIEGRVRRLAGAAPHASLAMVAEWPAAFSLAEGRAYLVSARGDRWRWCPGFALDEAQRPRRVVVLDGLQQGRAAWWDPVTLAGAPEVTLTWPARAPDWAAFLQACRSEPERCGVQVQTLGTVPPAFVYMPPADLDIDLAEGAVVEGVRLVRLRGEGGAAEVWEGVDLDDGRRWAYKVPKTGVAGNAHEVERFNREITTMRRLRGAGCHRIVGPVERLRWGEGEERRIILRMPLMQSSLREAERALRADSGCGPDMASLQLWLRMAAEGLAQMHAQGVVHRDIKPSNLLLDAEGELFLADLGIAKDATRGDTLTRTNDMLGTERYMAPEQLRGARDIGAPADIYALAVSIDEVWRGEPSLRPGEGMPEPLGSVVRDMAAFDPTTRPSAEEVLRRLGAVGTSVPPVGSAIAPRRWRVAAGILLAALGASAFVPVALAPRVEILQDRNGLKVAEVVQTDGARTVVPSSPDPVLARALATLRPVAPEEVAVWRAMFAVLLNNDTATRRLTLDAGLQASAQTALVAIRARSEPRSAAIVVIDAANGDILAWAGQTFSGADANLDPMAPTPVGSLLHVPLVALALEQGEGDLSLDTPIDLELGHWTYLEFLGNDLSLHDDHPSGVMRVRDVVARSSGIGAAKLAMRQEPQALEGHMRAFGLLGDAADDPGLAVMPSSAVEVPAWAASGSLGERWLSAPPVALASMMSTFALDGQRFEPGWEAGPRAATRPLRSDPAGFRPALQRVVTDGTGKRACVAGFELGGKTATVRTGIAKEAVHSAFVGYVRGSGKAATLAVVVQDPSQGSRYGGVVAAPAFAELVAPTMKALGVSPDPSRASSCEPKDPPDPP